MLLLSSSSTQLERYYKLSRIVVPLHTNSLKAVRGKAGGSLAQLDQDWLTVRWSSEEQPFPHGVL